MLNDDLPPPGCGTHGEEWQFEPDPPRRNLLGPALILLAIVAAVVLL